MIDFKLRRVLILFVLFVGLGACKEKGCGDKSAEIPKTPMARVEQMTSKIPSGADSVMVISDLDAMRGSMNLIKNRLPETGVVETMQKQIQVQFGIDLLDAESYKRAGLAPDSSAVGAIHRSRLLVLLYVDNRQNFEKVLVEKAKNAFQIEAVTKTETVGKHQMKVLSEDPATQIAWMYQGKMALISMPATDPRGVLEDGAATLVLSEVADSKKESSLWSHRGFQDFKTALVENYPVALYMNATESLKSDAVKAQLEAEPNAKAVTDWVQENVTFVGAGLIGEGDEVRVKGYVGMKPETLAKVKQAQKLDAKADWSSYATEKLMLGLRLALNIPQGYELVLASMPEDDARGIRRTLKMAGDRLAVDVEQDVLQQLSGHIGVFFYGIAGNPMSLMRAQNPSDIARQVGLMAVVKFKSAEAVQALLAKIVANAGGAVTVRPFTNLPDDENFQVLSLNDQSASGNFFIHGDTVAFATTAFGDEAMHNYLTGERDDKKLADIKSLDLGKEFVTSDAYNGLYFYSARAQDNLGGPLAMGGVGQILGAIEEASLVFDADEQGTFGQLTIDLSPSTETDAPAKDEGEPKQPQQGK